MIEDPVITCPKCLQATDACAWTERPIAGLLPANEYQCPQCGWAFARRATGDVWRPIRCEAIASRL